MQDQLRALIARHCAWLGPQVAEIAKALGQLKADDGASSAVLRQAIGLNHQIAGTSGSMGFGTVSDAAGSLEQLLLAIAESGTPPASSQCAQILAHFSALQAASSGLQPEHSSLYDADLSNLGAVQKQD